MGYRLVSQLDWHILLALGLLSVCAYIRRTIISILSEEFVAILSVLDSCLAMCAPCNKVSIATMIVTSLLWLLPVYAGTSTVSLC